MGLFDRLLSRSPTQVQPAQHFMEMSMGGNQAPLEEPLTIQPKTGVFGELLENGPGQSEEDLVDFVAKEFDRRQKERRAFELGWRLNLSFYDGNQYFDINTATMNLEEQPTLYEWQEREVFNNIAPNIETRISKLKRIRPILKVMPASTDQEDVHAAKIGTQLLKNFYADQNFRDIMSDALCWMELSDSIFFKHIWNPKIGRIIAKEQSPDGSINEVREGDIEVILCPAQEIYPDSCYRQDIDKCRSIIHAKAYMVDEIEEIWGKKVESEDAEAEKLARSMTGLGGLGYGQGGFRFQSVKLENSAIVKEYSEIPSKKYPKGRLIIVANKVLLYAGPLPFNVAEDNRPGLNFVKLDCLKRPGIFFGKTVCERMIPVQRRYNALRNRKAEYLNRCAIGEYDIEEDSVDIDEFERNVGSPGNITVYAKGFSRPMLRQMPALPAAFVEEEATLQNEFAILSGVSEISRQSNAPTGVKSGVALSIVQEQDDTRLSNTAENIERAMIRNGKMQLRLYKQFANTERTLRSVGKNNVVEVQSWMGSQLRGEDVVLDTVSANTESPAMRRQMVFDLLESGLMNNPETGALDKELRSNIFEMIELGNWEDADNEETLHKQKAARENLTISGGTVPMAVDYDDHIMHISIHNKHRLTRDYEDMTAKNPVIDQMFSAHVNMHLQYMAQVVMQQQQQAMMAQGGQEPPVQ